MEEATVVVKNHRETATKVNTKEKGRTASTQHIYPIGTNHWEMKHDYLKASSHFSKKGSHVMHKNKDQEVST